MNDIKIFNYNGANISFAQGETTMINATEMAKPFGKRPAKWLELPSSKEFLAHLRAIRKSDRLVVTSNGIGTWMHEDVALEFARWLSPEFAIWCNDRIKELMKFGFTATPQKLDELLSNPDLIIGLATQLKEARQKVDELNRVVVYQTGELQARKKQSKIDHQAILDKTAENIKLSRKNKALQKEVDDSASMVQYFYQCAEAADESLLNFRQTAALLGIKERHFLEVLHYCGIIYYSKDKPMPYAKYLDKGYFRVVDCPSKDGKRYFYQAKITTEGRKYINDNWERFENTFAR